MRNTFIDIKTSQAFNGQPPYIFRFEEGQSTNLNYVKKICVVSDKENLIIKTEPDQTIFRILKLTQDIPNHLDTIKLNLKVYADLDSLIAQNNEWESTGFQYVTEYEPLQPGEEPPGTPSQWMWIHMLYILGRSENSGEYTCSFWIDDEEYKILADFYDENEVLKTNLKNFESKLPESIQKAIYECDVHEDMTDNILVNRKNKELLMNYMEILGNKGSYESLMNSLDWFEWGDLVQLEEVWKRYVNDELDYNFFLDKLNKELNPEDILQLSNHIKTTYLALHCALDKFYTVNGRIIYKDSLGYHPIGSGTNWQLESSTHMHNPSTLYNGYSELETSSIIQNPNEYQDAESAELGTEQVLTPEEFLNLHPGTKRQVSNTGEDLVQVGDWIYNSSTHTWEEVTQGIIDNLPTGDNITYWHIDFNYISNEHMPDLLRVSTIWTAQDISLKMSMFGTFFSSFFMPIHLDLIHSCIEYWAYSYALKLLNTQITRSGGAINKIHNLDLKLNTDGRISQPKGQRWMTDITPFLAPNSSNIFGYSISPMSFEERIQEIGGTVINYNLRLLENYYNGPACSVHGKGRILTFSKDPNLVIWKQRLVWMNENNMYGEIISYTPMYPKEKYIHDSIPVYEPGHYYHDESGFHEITNENSGGLRCNFVDTYSKQQVIPLDFMLGIKESGDYILFFEFYDNAGNIYTGKYTTTVYDYSFNSIELMKLNYVGGENWSNDLVPPLNLYQYAEVIGLDYPIDDKEIYLQSHFLSNSGSSKLNHTLIIPFLKDSPGDVWNVNPEVLFINEYGINVNATQIYVDSNDNIDDFLNILLGELNLNFPEYWWFWDKGQISIGSELELQDGYRIIGIQHITENVVNVENLGKINGYVRMVSEERFYPIFHELIQIGNPKHPETFLIDPNDIICVIPRLSYGNYINEVTWEFINKSTGNIIKTNTHTRLYNPTGDYADIRNIEKPTGGLSQTPILNIKPEKLTPGYYDVILYYKIGNEVQTRKFSSVFIVKKQ